MRVLIDLGSIKSGGGAQLAINFLRFFKEYPPAIEKVYLLLPEKGPLAVTESAAVFDGSLTYPDSYWKRKLFEIFTLSRVVKDQRIDVVYTFFGAGLPSYKGVRSVVSVAYPIICYPESPFWKYAPPRLKWTQRGLNWLRCRRIRRANVVVAETRCMAERLARNVDVDPDKIVVVPPSPSAFIIDKEARSSRSGETFRILLLSGLDQHKNLWRLPAIARHMRMTGSSSFCFLISVRQEDFLAKYPHARNFSQELTENFEFVGAIPSENIQSVYDRADALMNISDLESFSNNYMEAWKTGLPLICSDRDFSRSICRNSAIYVEPHDEQKAAQQVSLLIEDNRMKAELVSNGKSYLKELPTLEHKFQQTMNLLSVTHHA